MPKLTKGLSVLMACMVVGVFVVACDDFLNGVDPIVVDELNRLSVQPTDDAEVSKLRLPVDLRGSGFNATVGECLEGGYDLLPYAGQVLTQTSVVIEGNCQDLPIKIYVLSTEEKIACAYLSVADPTIPVAPGIWSVKDPFCTLETPTDGCDGRHSSK